MSMHATQELSVSGLVAGDNEELGLDEIFGTLSNSRRRAAIAVVLEYENITFRELVDRVAEVEYGHPIEDISSDERHRIYVALQQTHVRKLEEAGAIDNDDRRITPGPNADLFEAYLEKIGERSLITRLRQVLA